MTRNAMLCVLQNLITSKKQHIDVPRTDEQTAKSDQQFGNSSESKKTKKSKRSFLKRDISDDKKFDTISNTNLKPKKRSSLKATFFLRKSR